LYNRYFQERAQQVEESDGLLHGPAGPPGPMASSALKDYEEQVRPHLVVVCHLVCHIWRWISRKPLEIEVWFQGTTNRKWPIGYQMVTWPVTSRDPERSNSWPQYA